MCEPYVYEQEVEKCRARIASITIIQSRFRAREAWRRFDELREDKAMYGAEDDVRAIVIVQRLLRARIERHRRDVLPRVEQTL